MAEKKKTARNSKTKTSTPTQKTLFDLFPSKPREDATSKAETDGGNLTTDVTFESDVTTPAAFTRPSAPSVPQQTCSKALPIRNQDPPNPPPPRKLYSIFEQSDASQKKATLTHDSEPDVIEIADHQPVASASHSNHSSDAPILSMYGSTPDDPIILYSSPLKPPTVKPPRTFSQPSFSIFATATRKHDKDYTDKATPHANSATSIEAPFPSEDSQHVRGPQSSFSSPALNFTRRVGKKQTISSTDTSKILLPSLAVPDDESLSYVQLPSTSTPLDRQNYLKTIPSEHILHPAVAQRLDPLLPPSHFIATAFPQKTWADRWRPTRAEQVLGNERQAFYLRDWLRSLELDFVVSTPAAALPTQNMKTMGKRKVKGKEAGRDLKRPRVVRAVEKKRGRRKQRMDSEEEDDWIVDSDESSEPDNTGDSEDEYPGETLLQRRDALMNGTTLNKPGGDMSHTTHNFKTKLTNTILITGPPGCGKTAAVYACADELGWEVFEVYPGIGKRNASSLDNLVGDVGKNHLVRKTQHHTRPRQTRDAFTALLGKEGKAKDDTKPGPIGTEDKPIEIEVAQDHSGHSPHGSTSIGDFGFISMSDSSLSKVDLNETQATTVVRQSVVLLEEVDILFKEDSSFWPAVVSLIKDCKRPVIMTCNDVTLVPTADLPIQDILTFKSIPPPLAVSYLQSLCLAEGQVIERQYLQQLYDTTYELSAVDQSVLQPSRDGLPVPDLRRAIHQLQFLCSGNAELDVQSDSLGSFEDMVDWNKFTEPLPVGRPQDQLGRSGGYHSDLLSYADSVVVRHPLEKPDALGLGCDDELGHTLLVPWKLPRMFPFHYRDDEIAHAIIRFSLTRAVEARRIANPVVAYHYQIVEALENSIPRSAWSVGSVVYLDYEPWIRRMVCIDDMHERDDVVQWGGRMRRSRTKYVRMMGLSEEQRGIIDSTKFTDL